MSEALGIVVAEVERVPVGEHHAPLLETRSHLDQVPAPLFERPVEDSREILVKK